MPARGVLPHIPVRSSVESQGLNHELLGQQSTRESILEPYVTSTASRTIFPVVTAVYRGIFALHAHLTCNYFVTRPLL